MKCEKCQIDKLSEEFPFGTISSKCEHITSWCLKCLAIYLKETQHQCPICKAELTEQEFDDYCLLWDNASFKIDFESFSQIRTEFSEQNNSNSGMFYVVRLNGEKFELKISEINTVRELKYRLMKYTKIDISRQMLIYKDVELEDGVANTLTSYGIRENSHIQLIVILYSISKKEAVKNLVFDLYWGYNSKMDFLDGTCLIYKGNNLWKKYDYKNKVYSEVSYISHSGDIMDSKNATGHHKITVKLDQLPAKVTQLYLILSSFVSPTIGHFRDPSFKLYDEARPDKQLCNYNIHRADKSQAVIMCLINRSYYGKWNVIEVGRLSQGNALNYGPIMENIKDINKLE
ncbi:21887_t:CDS:2, partial [Dentiscutata erythropus]